MIEGYGLTLREPDIKWLKPNSNAELNYMIDDIIEYFKQEGTIYDATLIMTNCQYSKISTEHGDYNKRINYEVDLRFVTHIRIYKDYIIFHSHNGSSDDAVRVEITDNFIYAFDWETAYYA